MSEKPEHAWSRSSVPPIPDANPTKMSGRALQFQYKAYLCLQMGAKIRGLLLAGKDLEARATKDYFLQGIGWK